METTKSPTIGSFVAADYRTATVFQKYGIDFCCKGGRLIDDVCEKQNISSHQLLNELAEISKQPDSNAVDFQTWSLDLLADYIEKKHHRYIEQNTPALQQFLDKLCEVHGINHPELFEIREEFNASAEELAKHMIKEEQILFPFIRTMVTSDIKNVKPDNSSFGTVQNPIQLMMEEHVVEGERFQKISEISDNYTTPADGCTTYRVAYALLKEFDNDLHKHIHLENNILFPKAIEMEKKNILINSVYS